MKHFLIPLIGHVNAHSAHLLQGLHLQPHFNAHIYTLSEIMHSGFPDEGSWERSAEAACT